MTPFLNWAGGKQWFVRRFPELLPTSFNRYIEPFLGAGSVFFHLQPADAILGDSNVELIAAYEGIKSDPVGLRKQLLKHQNSHSPDYYYKIRAATPKKLIERAARLIYLNRTCFNGIYRVNQAGQFNVPIGSKSQVITDEDDFVAIATALVSTELYAGDFEALIDNADDGDLVFTDPPYTVRHNYNGFIKYNEKLFSWEDQERLAHALGRARKRNVKVVSTNANHASVRGLYENAGFEIETVSRLSSISAKIDSRKSFEELIILSSR